MKVIIAVMTMLVSLMLIAVGDINKKLDKLIELNTPEYVNVIPQEMIVDKN